MASNEQKIAKNQANLPLPEDPPKASDFNSADQRVTGTGNGAIEGHAGTDAHSDLGLGPGPATKGSDADMSAIGREGKDNLKGPPRDAAAR